MVYIDWNLLAENGPYYTELSFLEWYEEFFLAIIRRQDVNGYGYSRN